MFMRSGLNDYDDDERKEQMMAAPDYDPSPGDWLTATNGTFLCAPGTCHHYSSINYILI
jgi:CubicO group peptidase (beta-lactamase class C family)